MRPLSISSLAAALSFALGTVAPCAREAPLHDHDARHAPALCSAIAPACPPWSLEYRIGAKRRQQLAQAVQGHNQIAEAPPAAFDVPPARVPDAVASGSIGDKIKAIGAQALIAATRVATAGHSAAQLLELAQAQINAGDSAGAQQTLRAAQTLIEQTRGVTGSSYRDRAITLWVRSGDVATARAWVDSAVDAVSRVAMAGRYGVSLAKSGDTKAARAALDLVEQMSSAIRSAGEGASAKQPSPQEFRDPPRDIAVSEIGAALADAGDFRGALSAAARLPPGIVHAGLLADIASKQCASSEPSARDTLSAAQSAVQAAEQKRLVDAATRLVHALASCDDRANAVATAHDLVPDSATVVLERVAQQFTDHHDYVHAAQIDNVLAENTSDLAAVIALAQRQMARSEIPAAIANLATASAQIRRATPSPIDPAKALAATQLLSAITDLQIKAGAFSDAGASAEPLERNYRPQFLVRLIEAEAQRHDADALSQTLPVAIPEIQAADLLPTRAIFLAEVAKVLGRAGELDLARQPLALARALAQQGITGSYLRQILADIAAAQTAMGDPAGARVTLEAVERSNRDVWLLGLVRELCLAKDFRTALAMTAQIDRPVHDWALAQIASSQARAGDMSAAMVIAWQITEPKDRADAMLELLKAARRT